MAKDKFIIEPHFRLQEWVAEEKGYFKDEGLDYVFQENIKSTDGAHHYKGDKVGAMQALEKGRTSDVSCACHWTVGVAASKGKGKLYGDVYSVSPAGVFVPKDSPVQKPEDLAGVPIAVGYQSGSHYSTVQALEQYMPLDKINLTFADGMLFNRLDKLLDGSAKASTLFSGPYYFAEQLGYRKVIDCTFMIATTITGDPDPEDIRKFFRALRRAQRDIDLRPGELHALLQERIPGALSQQDGYAALGAGRAAGVRALHQGGLRRDLQVDRRPRHLRRYRHGLGQVRRGGADARAVRRQRVPHGWAWRQARRAHALAARLACEPCVKHGALRARRAKRALPPCPSIHRDAQPDQPVERRVILEQVGRARAMHDGAALDHDGIAGQRQRDLGVLLDQDDGGALVGDHAPDRGRQLLDDDRREPFQRLVEQQQRRIGHQRARDRQHLLLAAGELVAPAAARSFRRGNSS